MKKLMPCVLSALVLLSFTLGSSSTLVTARPTEQEQPENVDQTIQGAWGLEYLGNLDLSEAYNVTVAGNYAYLPAQILGMYIVDISEPAVPVVVGMYSNMGLARNVAIAGNYAYLADEMNGLEILDISDPANPLKVGSYIPAGKAFDVTVAGNFAYLAANEGGLRVVNISDPANPVEVSYDDTYFANNIAVSGNYAYEKIILFQYAVAGIRVMDISNPASPTEVGYYQAPYASSDLAVQGNYAYLSDLGVRVIDISDPTHPSEVGYYEGPWNYGVAVADNLAYLAGGGDEEDRGLRVIDISNPAQPFLEALYEPLPNAYGVAVSENYAYVAALQDGMYVLRYTPALDEIDFILYRDGYSFPNYGAKEYGDYSSSDMQRMFGDSAVCWMVGSGCEIRSQASLWNTYNYQMMNAGHSYGMAVSGLRFFKEVDAHPADASVYDMDKTSEVLFSWEGESLTTTLRRDIGFFTVSQFVEPLRSTIYQSLERTPVEVFTQVQAALAADDADPVILQLYAEGRGHALIPYALTSSAEGIYEVWAYDNEHPGDGERAVIFDLNVNTWSYDAGDGMWSGNATSHNLGIIPTGAHSQVMDCPWCTGSHLLTLDGDGHLLISDSQGRQLGFAGSQYMEEIPGGYGLAPILGTAVAHEPVYTLPLTETYSILLDGQTVSQTASASLWQFGPGYAASLLDVNVGPGTQDQLTISGDGTLVGYHATQAQEPTLMLALDVLSATYGLDMQWIDIGAGEAVTLTADTTQGVLVIDGSQDSGGFYNLLIRKASEAGGFPFYLGDIEILAGDTHIIHFGAWDGYGAITLEIDHGSDGTSDETLLLINQIQWSLLPLITK